MRDVILGAVVFGGLVIGIVLSYRLFMRGDTNGERIASRLPKDFKPEWSWRCGDTFVGYERSSDRLAIVDYPHASVVRPRDVASIEPLDEGALGINHRWLVVNVSKAPAGLRVWFGLSAEKRDAALARLKEIIARR
jgi:hypothetical protein